MGKRRSGSFQRFPDGSLRLRIPITVRAEAGRTKTKRIWAKADPNLTDEEAKQLAEKLTQHFMDRIVDAQEVYRALRGEQITTVHDFVLRVYLPTRSEQKTHQRQLQWWQIHVLPVLGDCDVRTFDGEVLREVVRALDEKVADESVKFDWKTAKNVWGLVTKFCSDLAESKNPRIRIRQDNPARGVRGPDVGDKSVKQWLYPSELHQLLNCEHVPVSRRRMYAMLVYFFARAGEVYALDFETRVNLKHGIVTINRARNLRTGEFGPTKTRDTRVFPIEPILLPMLNAMHSEGAGFVGTERGARMLRKDLLAAGVTRHELHHRVDRSLPVTQHDLRATGITYLAMRGETDDAVRERAGHTDFKMTMQYIRRGRRIAGADLGDPFATLPKCLLNDDGRVRRTKPEYIQSSKVSSTQKTGSPETPTNLRASAVGARGFEPLTRAVNSDIPRISAASAGLKSRENARSERSLDDFVDDTREPADPLIGAARDRLRHFERLAELDADASPGLALCRGLEAAYAGDLDEVERRLGEALEAHGGELRPGPGAAIGGGR